ncbi:sensor histidine kinase [Catenulispora yoronensis]|uniref:sensor histidine kinase n=1 Tax=Catenulispora yoronensis TaxID=450799 RepID=UPI0031D851E4
MEKAPRSRWWVDGFLVAMYAVLVAVNLPRQRPFTDYQVFPVGLMNEGTGRLAFPPGAGEYVRTYHADNWERLVPTLLTILLLPMLRRRPLAVAVCLGLSELSLSAVDAAGDARYALFIMADAVVLNIALHWPRRTSLTAAAVVLAGALSGVAGFPWGATSLLPTHAVVISLLTTVAWLVGNSIRERRAGAARQRADAAAQAVADERLRIARELHDMIAHSIGIIAIQAGMGNRVIATQPGEARKALQAIEETSRDTLSQLRRTLTALRQRDVAGAPTEPTPGLADLGKLVASTKHAGVLAIVETSGLSRPLPGEVDLAAYRIVQESVTNVVRHSGARTCRVAVDYGEGAVTITVSDDGHGVLGSGGTGFGLVGMRERVSLVHGEFSAGPRPGGGFLVRAKLPVPGGFGTTFGGALASKNSDTDGDGGSNTDSESDSKSDSGGGAADEPVPGADAAPTALDPNPAVTQ